MSSVSITRDELVDFGLFDEWTSGLLRDKGADLYRMKGVINARFATQKYVYHAVHMIYNGDFEEWDEEEEKGNKLVFIGKNIDGAALRKGFEACLATPENLAKKEAGLRFKVGQRVECNMGGGVRKAGVVTAVMYRDEEMEQGQVCPYKVRARTRARARACGLHAAAPQPPDARETRLTSGSDCTRGRSSSTMARARGRPTTRTTASRRSPTRRPAPSEEQRGQQKSAWLNEVGTGSALAGAARALTMLVQIGWVVCMMVESTPLVLVGRSCGRNMPELAHALARHCAPGSVHARQARTRGTNVGSVVSGSSVHLSACAISW